MAEDAFPLVELIASVSRELREAQHRAVQDPAPDMLRLKECSIELGIAWEKKGEGELQLWVVKLGGNRTKTNTQTISVTLQPTGDVVVADD